MELRIKTFFKSCNRNTCIWKAFYQIINWKSWILMVQIFWISFCLLSRGLLYLKPLSPDSVFFKYNPYAKNSLCPYYIITHPCRITRQTPSCSWSSVFVCTTCSGVCYPFLFSFNSVLSPSSEQVISTDLSLKAICFFATSRISWALQQNIVFNRCSQPCHCETWFLFHIISTSKGIASF